MKLRANYFLLYASVLAATLLLGCRNEIIDPSQPIRAQHDQLIDKYLQGNVEQAKESLKQAINLIQNETVMTQIGHDNHLILDYDRLYVLEKRIGNESAAKSYFMEARDLDIKALELINTPADEISKELKSYDEESIMKDVDKLDKMQNNGNLPAYLQYIPKK
jgi:uncharacterized protein YacL (UPF0231 family)